MQIVLLILNKEETKRAEKKERGRIRREKGS